MGYPNGWSRRPTTSTVRPRSCMTIGGFPNDPSDLMRRGAASRATSATRINAISSRSHAVFTITVEQLDLDQSRKGVSIVSGLLMHWTLTFSCSR